MCLYIGNITIMVVKELFACTDIYLCSANFMLVFVSKLTNWVIAYIFMDMLYTLNEL